MAAILRDSTVVVVRTRPRAIPLAMITMRKSTHGFPFVSHIWVAYGAPLGGPSGHWSSAIKAADGKVTFGKKFHARVHEICNEDIFFEELNNDQQTYEQPQLG